MALTGKAGGGQVLCYSQVPSGQYKVSRVKFLTHLYFL